MTNKEIREEIKRLRKEIWAKRTPEEKAQGTGWVCLDYVAMNRIEVLQEELDKREGKK